ncbi:MAG TPA: type IV toxin-antitoxin system AbiEi family antitoxin domain-containing protein [Solirubrobacteraceae bacterium]|nr:type IV toxin-antitoxin system AbiEi family antitoxin domain-containing protein [Solirubrobacteraceae bacterium]
MGDALDKLIAAVAGNQYGYVTRTQLLTIGLGPAAIKYRVRIGRLIPVYAGVYAVGSVNDTPVARAMAAVLACGERAVLSHGSAATLWGFDKYWELPFELIAPVERRHKGIMVHRSRTLVAEDMTRQLGVPVTTPERTALDIAPRLTDRRLTRVVNDARHAGFLHLNDLADVLDRNPHHRGTKRLRRFVDNPRNPTRSPLEDDFLAFAGQYGLPAPVTNTHVLGYEVDVLYPVERVIVEIDGYPFHSDRDSFERDRDRDADMLAADHLTVRVTKERLNQTPEREARRLNHILEARRKAA